MQFAPWIFANTIEPPGTTRLIGKIAGRCQSAYESHHPFAADLGLAIEVADTSLARDRHDKGRIYASAGIPLYWVVNLVDRQIEVYRQPSPAGAAADYAASHYYQIGDDVPLVLDGGTVALLSVAEFLA